TGERIGGSVWYYSSNLLQNPDASSSSMTAWTQGGGTWAVTAAPVTLGSYSINSSNGSPWFLNTQLVVANSCTTCASTRVTTLVQTVDVSAYANILHAYAHMAVVYRGDAFAVGNRTGSGSSIYRSHAGYQASYTLDFFDTAGNLLATDTSGYIFTGPNFACVFLTQPRQSYGYRQIATGILSATRTIRFTA